MLPAGLADVVLAHHGQHQELHGQAGALVGSTGPHGLHKPMNGRRLQRQVMGGRGLVDQSLHGRGRVDCHQQLERGVLVDALNDGPDVMGLGGGVAHALQQLEHVAGVDLTQGDFSENWVNVVLQPGHGLFLASRRQLRQLFGNPYLGE